MLPDRDIIIDTVYYQRSEVRSEWQGNGMQSMRGEREGRTDFGCLTSVT